MKGRYNASKETKQLIWNLKFHADTVATFNKMNKTLNLQHHSISWIIWRHIKGFTKCFHRKSVCPVTWWATGNEKPARFLETVTLYEAFRGIFKGKLDSSICCHTMSVRTCFRVCICVFYVCICRLGYLAYHFFCKMLFLFPHLNIVNIFCYLNYVPAVYLKSCMLCLRCVYCLLFSKTH